MALMLTIATTAPATRKRRAAADERDCRYCGARYAAFRTGLGGAGEHASALIAAAGRKHSTASYWHAGDGSGDGSHVTIATARRDLGKIKRAMFAAEHGPGACCADMADDEQIDRALDLAFNLGSDDAPF